MVSKAASVFEQSLPETGATCERVTADGLKRAIGAAVTDPAVGVPIARVDVSLAQTPVAVDPTPGEVRAARTGVTGADLGIADYGSVVLPCDDGSEFVSLFVEKHVVILRERDVVSDMETAFAEVGTTADSGGSVVLATGPSATADMGELVRGAHGPEDVHVIVLAEE